MFTVSLNMGVLACVKNYECKISVTSSVTGEFSLGKRRWQGEKGLDDDGSFRVGNMADRVFCRLLFR